MLHLNGLEGQPLNRTLARRYLRLSLLPSHYPTDGQPHPSLPPYPLSAFFLASMYEKGEGGEVNAGQALVLYRAYAGWVGEEGEWYGESVLRAGRLAMEGGKRGEEGWERGWGEVRRAAEVGHVEAMLMVAQRAAEDAQAEGDVAKEQEARRWMSRAQEELKAQLLKEHGVEGAQRLMRETRHEQDEDEDEAADARSAARPTAVVPGRRPPLGKEQGSKVKSSPVKSSWSKRGKKRR